MTPEKPDLRLAIMAGFVATLTLTVLMYCAPLLGFPPIDMASAIGGFLGEPAALFSVRWFIGFAVYFAAGTFISPLLFVYAMPMLYGRAWLRGLEWGFILWMFGGVCGMIFLGLAFHPPFTEHPHLTSLSSVIGNLIYGGVLGALAARIIRPHPAT